MSTDASRKANRNGNANGLMPPPTTAAARQKLRLRLNPSADHKPESYEDMQLEFSPLLFSSLERYLPPAVLNSSRDAKFQVMRNILTRYSPDGERTRVSINPSLL
uniref:Uncharacterized protein MANES_14G108800 n=1 Tax=Rhizophora mucronata TaxID=61149 RepID=A0A2P2K540_RHIMU